MLASGYFQLFHPDAAGTVRAQCMHMLINLYIAAVICSHDGEIVKQNAVKRKTVTNVYKFHLH